MLFQTKQSSSPRLLPCCEVAPGKWAERRRLPWSQESQPPSPRQLVSWEPAQLVSLLVFLQVSLLCCNRALACVCTLRDCRTYPTATSQVHQHRICQFHVRCHGNDLSVASRRHGELRSLRQCLKLRDENVHVNVLFTLRSLLEGFNADGNYFYLK